MIDANGGLTLINRALIGIALDYLCVCRQNSRLSILFDLKRLHNNICIAENILFYFCV